MTLLFITQKLHGQDAFGILWIKGFIARGYDVHVVCLEWRPEEARKALGTNEECGFTVHSLGKERGVGKIGQVSRFFSLMWTLPYDRVFIHMTPVWGIFGALPWIIRKKPVYLWYTHYKMQLGLRMLGIYARRMFCATPQSLPQYEASQKKVVVGHGIDLGFWPMRQNQSDNPHKLLVVHRLSRSKRLEIIIRAVAILPPNYTLDIYGIEAEQDYVAEMKALVETLGLSARVTFHGSIPAKDLPDLYVRHRLIFNMASETIDKTMLEAMTCGCYPVTTKGNAAAIGIPSAPQEDTPEALVAFVETYKDKAPLTGREMYEVVEKGHSLARLIEKMDAYIKPGT